MTNLQDLFFKTREEGKPINLDLESSVFPDIRTLAKSVLKYHANRKSKNSSHILMQREKLGPFLKKIGRKTSALIPPDNEVMKSLDSKIESLAQRNVDDVILLMSAHQPNLFPYSGVTRKIALMVALRNTIQELIGKEKDVICFYGVADHDFAHNKWIRSAELPAPLRKEGILRFNVKVPQKDIMLPANRIPKPSIDIINSWKTLTESWLTENAGMAEKYLGLHSSSHTSKDKELESRTRKYAEDFWQLADRAYSVSETLAEFNSILLYLTVLEEFEEPILFANFSDCFTIFRDEFSWMLDNAGTISEIITNNEIKLKAAGIDSGLADDIGEVFPLWLKCSCGSKYRLSEDSSSIAGTCKRCGSEVGYSVQELKELIQSKPELFEPRSITMPIAFASGIDISCYIGGIGGLGYLVHTRAITDRFQMPLPPTPFWYVDDTYISLELLCSAFQVERLANIYSVDIPKHNLLDSDIIEDASSTIISAIDSRLAQGTMRKGPETQRDRQLLSNIQTSLKTKGCMIDYAINIGLKYNFEQWIQFLENDGRLQVPVQLHSVFAS
jgi:hypothetical protein